MIGYVIHCTAADGTLSIVGTTNGEPLRFPTAAGIMAGALSRRLGIDTQVMSIECFPDLNAKAQ